MTTAKRHGIYFGVFLLLLTLVAFVPGFEFNGRIPNVIGVHKSSNEFKQEFSIEVGKCHVRNEINYDAVNDFCWGPEGFSTRKGYLYFRMGTFELSAWVER